MQRSPLDNYMAGSWIFSWVVNIHRQRGTCHLMEDRPFHFWIKCATKTVTPRKVGQVRMPWTARMTGLPNGNPGSILNMGEPMRFGRYFICMSGAPGHETSRIRDPKTLRTAIQYYVFLAGTCPYYATKDGHDVPNIYRRRQLGGAGGECFTPISKKFSDVVEELFSSLLRVIAVRLRDAI